MAVYSVTFKHTEPEDGSERFKTFIISSDNELDAVFRAGIGLGVQVGISDRDDDLETDFLGAKQATDKFTVVHVINEDLQEKANSTR